MHNKKIFIVVGMHRSGTSLITHCLQSCGLRLSDELIPPSQDNPQGFFEDKRVVELNSKIEAAIDREHTNPTSTLSYPSDWVNRKDVRAIAAELKEYLSERCNEDDRFLIKDPRVCRLLPLYVDILRDIDVTPVYIYVHRDPTSVIRSKSARDCLDQGVVESQWLASNMSALTIIYSEGSSVCFVGYEALLKKTKSELARIESFLKQHVALERSGPFPEILKQSLAKKLSKDRSDVSIKPFSKDVASFLMGAEDRVAGSGHEPKIFIALRKKYAKLSEFSELWQDVIHVHSQSIKSTNETLKDNIRLRGDLKLANGRVFGLGKQVETMNAKASDLGNRLEISEQAFAIEKNGLKSSNQELKSFNNELKLSIEELEVFNKNLKLENEGLIQSVGTLESECESLRAAGVESKQQYDALHQKHSDLSVKFQALSLRQRRKIFIVASKLDHLKTRLRAMFLISPLQKVREIRRVCYEKLLMFRRSMITSGFRVTLVKSARAIKAILSRWFGEGRHIAMQKQVQHSQNKSASKVIFNESVERFNKQQSELISDIFIEQYYKQVAGLSSDLSYLDALKHFVEVGIDKGLSPSPLFCSATYLDKLKVRDSFNGNAFLHWLYEGAQKRVVPTVLFDEQFFVARHSLLLRDDEWAFRRFIALSVFKNATPNQYFDSNWYRQNHDLSGSDLPPFYHYLVVGAKRGWRPSPMFPSFSRTQCADFETSPMEHLLKLVDFDSIRTRVRTSPLLLELVNKAAEIEPSILSSGVQRINVLPYTTPNFPAISNIRSSIKRSSYDSIVLIPHCRYGGAGLVAGELCASLRRLLQDEHVLLIRTDNDDFMRPDWFPSQIEVLNMLDFSCDVADSQRKKVLLDLLIGLKPKRIFNVHSRLGWEVFTEFGDRLKRWSSLYGYTFCYDLSPLGAKAGYPIKYVPNAIEYMKQLFVDNEYLKKDLVSSNGWSRGRADKVVVMRTPSGDNPDIELYDSFEDTNNRKRKKIFWAGRFDRQKRFDLVVKLAERNPELDFWVWGAAMLGDDEAQVDVPKNIFLQGLFENYTEIPFNDCDAWLYTSQWDGVPTILIELGLRRVPLVASQVWGTSDLIKNNTAWPVSDVTSVADYEVGIKEVISDRRGAKQRAKNLRELILDRYNREKYDQCLNKILADDTWSKCNG